jgi:GGDEF domain-containing protein/CHASE3 domain sensor protein
MPEDAIQTGEVTGGAPLPGSPTGPARVYRMGIAARIFTAFGAMAGLVVLIAVGALIGLERINRINRSILQVNIPLIKAADRMIDNVLDQEVYARRSTILGSDEMMRVFWERGREFDRQLKEIGALPETGWVPAERIGRLHDEYNAKFQQELSRAGAPSGDKEREDIRAVQEELITALREISLRASREQHDKTTRTAAMGAVAFRAMAAACVVGLVLSVLLTLMLDRSIARPLRRLQAVTERIAEGKFDAVPDIHGRDELADLSRAFAEMIVRLRRFEEMYLDANPLTRLPGSVALENVLRKRIEARTPLAFCLVDMDNFKAYNDRYGYARGSEFIKKLGVIVRNAVDRWGTGEDFVGHIGGDDLVVVTVPERFREICENVIAEFDAAAPAFYDPEDLRRGFIRVEEPTGR